MTKALRILLVSAAVLAACLIVGIYRGNADPTSDCLHPTAAGRVGAGAADLEFSGVTVTAPDGCRGPWWGSYHYGYGVSFCQGMSRLDVSPDATTTDAGHTTVSFPNRTLARFLRVDWIGVRVEATARNRLTGHEDTVVQRFRIPQQGQFDTSGMAQAPAPSPSASPTPGQQSTRGLRLTCP